MIGFANINCHRNLIVLFGNKFAKNICQNDTKNNYCSNVRNLDLCKGTLQKSSALIHAIENDNQNAKG